MVWIPCGNRILYLEVKNTHLLEVEKLKGGLREIGNDAGQLVKVKSLSHLKLFATPWTVAYQAPPSMGFSRQECWSGVPSCFISQQAAPAIAATMDGELVSPEELRKERIPDI